MMISNISGSLVSFRGELLKKWFGLGYNVYALAPSFKSEDKKWLKDNDITPVKYKLNRSGMNPVTDAKSLISLKRRFAEIEPDYIFAYTVKPVIYSSLLSKKFDLKGMYSLIPGLGYAFMNRGWKNKIINRIVVLLYKMFLRNNDKVFFQNPDDRELFVRKGLIKQNKTVVVNGSGVDTDYYYFTEVDTSNCNFLMLSRLLKSKGVVEYIEAAKKVKNNYPEAVFNLAGSPGKGPDAVDMEYVNEADEKGIIEYHGRLEDVRSAIEKCTAYVLPSYYREGTPRSVLEAMSIGRPIITTDNPGCRETVQNGHNGFLVSVKDAETLADKMEYFIENPDQAAVMGKNSRKMAEEKYDVHKVNETITEAMGI